MKVNGPGRSKLENNLRNKKKGRQAEKRASVRHKNGD